MATALLDSAPLHLLPPAYRGPRGRILLDLKRNGFNTARGLADSLGISLNTVRHHLRELESEALVEHRREHRGLGAPTFAFQLSAAGDQLFPERCTELVTQVLDRVCQETGRAAVAGALQERFDALAARIEHELGAGHEGKMEVVQRALVENGFMAEWSEDGDGFRLTEHHCAFRALVERFPEVCEIEARFLDRVLSARVERTSHMLTGCGACQYRVQFTESNEAPAGGRGRESA